MLTVMFADLVGFTAASDGADPEDVRARVRPFHALVRQEVARTGGTVARVMGDGVMVVWGYPRANEDDATRAIRAALAIRQGLAALGRDRHARIGINTGEAVVAFGSTDERADDAMGDAVNVAARFASAAPVDGIVIGEPTARLAGDGLQAEALPPLSLKGKADPVAALLVVGLSRPVASPTGGPFLGRERELATLRDAYTRARDGRCVAHVLVTGEPGIGKTRLLRELRDELVAAHGATWYTGQCQPDTATPGWVFGEIVKEWSGITYDDGHDDAGRKLDAQLPADLPHREWLRETLGTFVGLDRASASLGADEGAAALTRFLSLVAANGPTVIAIEDVHWADTELAVFLNGPHLDAVDGPLLVVATSRPAPDAVAAGPDGLLRTRIRLEPLRADEASALVGAVAGSALSPTVRAAISRRCGGNPLFVGELVRLAAQRAAPDAEDRRGEADLLPETIQAVIAARFDLLGADARAVARDAAVLGESCPRDGLLALARLDPARSVSLDTALDELMRLDVLRADSAGGVRGAGQLAFRHALVRDVAYSQLTRADRATRHAAAARWLAGVGGPDRGDLAGQIADHDLRALELAAAGGLEAPQFNAASVSDHALTHLVRAGDHLRGLDVRAAIERYRTAERLRAEPKVRLGVLKRLGRALADAGDDADALATCARALELAEALGDPGSAGEIHLVRARPMRTQGEAWHEPIRRAVELLEGLPPGHALVEAYAAAAYLETVDGSGEQFAHWAGIGIDHARRLGLEIPTALLSRRGFFRAMRGDPGGLDDIREAIDLGRASGDSYAFAEAVSDQAGAWLYLGRIEPCERAVRDALEIARARGLRGLEALTLTNLAYVLRIEGRFGESAEAIAAAHNASSATQDRMRPFLIEDERLQGGELQAGDDPWIVALRASHLATWTGRQGLYQELLAREEALEAAARGDETAFRAAFEGVYIETAEGDLDTRMALSQIPVLRAAVRVGALDLAERVVSSIARTCPIGASIHDALAGVVAAAHRRPLEARPRLERAIDAWDRMGLRPYAALLRSELAELEAAAGRVDTARLLWLTAADAWAAMGAPVRAAVAADRARAPVGGRAPHNG